MKRTKLTPLLLAVLLMCTMLTSCVTYGNKGADDLTESEKQEVINEVDKAKQEIEDELADFPELQNSVTEILDNVLNMFE